MVDKVLPPCLRIVYHVKNTVPSVRKGSRNPPGIEVWVGKEPNSEKGGRWLGGQPSGR